MPRAWRLLLQSKAKIRSTRLASSKLGSNTRELAGASAIYGFGNLAIKGLSFLLLPLYTHYLTPEDYGLVALTVTITSVLGILYPLGLHGALSRLYFDSPSETVRQQSISTLWIAMALVATVIAVLLHYLCASVIHVLVKDITFLPYIRMAIWTAFFAVFSLLPLTLLQIEKHPGLYVLATATSTVLSAGLIVSFVVIRGHGAYGYILGTLLTAVLLAMPYAYYTIRRIQCVFHWDILKSALAYSLPLIPYGLAAWVMDLSDRFILSMYLSLGEVGLYVLGYQLASVISLVAAAINAAWIPFLFSADAQRGDEAKTDLIRLTTYYTFILAWVALGLALLSQDALHLLTAPAFHAASQVIPWLVGGLLLGGLYYIPVSFLFLRSKTGYLPIVTITAGIINVGLNLWLAPRYGIFGTAWATLASYAAMLVLIWWIALRVYPFAYEYRCLGKIMLVMVGLFSMGHAVSLHSHLLEVVLRSALWFIFPAVLAALGVFTRSERELCVSYGKNALMVLRHRP